ncbi:MAG TPA: peptide-methionine (R)-S-oxide reductase MsrB [Candidatus Kapabacteria bacterium]|nr:peptide-methionine (R)-S-oxide reductase MsrB [Candidatus Kapabacteria bacterium]
MDKVSKSNEEWKKELTPEAYRVLREKGTEPAFSGAYYENTDTGTYHCAACDNELFTSEAKFDAGCGWPSFDRPAGDNRVEEHDDTSFGMRRTEVVCNKCGSHLGHVFPDGPTETGQRYCINSVAMKLKKKE